MTQQQIDNIHFLINSFKKYNITNVFVQAGILACVSKECNFIPQNENLNYSIERIKQLWVHTSDEDAAKIAHNPEAMGNFMYGGKYGNALNEGYKFRGRSFNQITFHCNYEIIGKKLGIDLVSNPDLLNDPKIAADATTVFFRDELHAGEIAGSFKKFNVTTISLINDTTTATKVAIQINAGRGTSFDNPIVKEGYNRALLQVDQLLTMVKINQVT